MDIQVRYKQLVDQLNDGDATEDVESKEDSFHKYDREGLSLRVICTENRLEVNITPADMTPVERIFVELYIDTNGWNDGIVTSHSIRTGTPCSIRSAIDILTAKGFTTSPVYLPAPEAMFLDMQRLIDAFLAYEPEMSNADEANDNTGADKAP